MPGPWDKYAKSPDAVQKNPGTPWEKYSADAAPAATPATQTPPPVALAPATPAQQPNMLDRLAGWGEKTFPYHPPSKDTAEELARPGVNVTNGVVRNLLALPAAAVHAVSTGWTPSQYWQQEGEKAQKGTPYTGQQPTGDDVDRYLTDTGSGLLTAELIGYGVSAGLRAPGAVKQMLTGDIHEPMPGSTQSPAQRYISAKNLGVDLDAADATNSPFFAGVKRAGEHSLFGGHVYDAAKAANTTALTGSLDEFLDGLHAGDHESGGRAIQNGLLADQRGLKSGAEGGFELLTDQTKGKPVEGAPAVGVRARELLNPIQKLAQQYPSLAPGKTMSVLDDLGTIGKAPKAPKLGAGGILAEFTGATPPAAPAAAPVTWSDLQRLRSGTHDLTTSNPDLVKSQAIAPLQQMTQSIDDAMTNGASGLTPAQAEIFRAANEDWRNMKSTYDDPSSPFYHAVRTDNPSQLFFKVGPQTAENARNLLGRLDAPGIGALRRGTVESALKTDPLGGPNMKTFPANFQRIPAEYRAELFSPQQNETLRDVGSTAHVLAKDFNPSGTAKLNQKITEGAAISGGLGLTAAGHPTGLLPLVGSAAQYPVARMMTSPTTVDWLMRAPTKPNLFFAPAAAAATLSAPKIDQRSN